MEIEHKKTTLDDDAAIYQKGPDRDENKSVKEKWSELDFKGKCHFFFDYYLLKLVFATAIIALIGGILYTTLKPRPKAIVGAVIIDSLLEIENTQQYFKDALTEIGGDPNKEKIELHDTFSSQIPNDTSTISTYIFAGTLDVLIAPESALQHYCENSILVDIGNLPEDEQPLIRDILDAVSEEDKFYYTDPKTGEKHLYGIRLDNTGFYKTLNTQNYNRTYIFTLVKTGEHLLNGVKLLRYMLGLPQIN